ncbi:MAG: hypothetical protein IH596_09990 [Bacteroidales bacterium]|nr:hypothetical protein [Bacteroidales bacterium]
MDELKFDYKYKDPEHGTHRELFYSLDKDGNYEKNVRFHDDSDRIFIEQFWDVQKERIEAARQLVVSGKKSPIYYYMEKNLMDPMTLSSQVSISLWRVKRHFKPTVFKKLKEETLAKYAEAFKLKVDELKTII